MVSLNQNAKIPTELPSLGDGCLVLSRKENEVTEIWKDGVLIAEIAVASLRGDKARLAFKGPQDVRFLRREVADAIRREHRQKNAGTT